MKQLFSTNRHRRTPYREHDLGRFATRLLCAIFALIGALPLCAGILAKSGSAQDWAGAETSRLLSELFQVRASYSVDLSLWPLQISIQDLVVPANDGGSPAIEVERAQIKPRVFALLAGRLDIGDISIEGARHRLVIEGGEVKNLSLKLPELKNGSTPLDRAPFSSLALNGAQFDVTIDGNQITTGKIDLDVFAERGMAFEVALRADDALVEYAPGLFKHGNSFPSALPKTARTIGSWEQDRLCQLEARLRIEPGEIFIRRLRLTAATDWDPDPKTATQCSAGELLAGTDTLHGAEKGHLSLRLNQTRLKFGRTLRDALSLSSNLEASLPAELGDRFTDDAGPFRGRVLLKGALSKQANETLPNFNGAFETGAIYIHGFRVVQSASADIEFKQGTLVTPLLRAGYAEGDVRVHNIKLEMLRPGRPIFAEKLEGTSVQFSRLIQDLRITPNTIVRWDLDRVLVTEYGGTLTPLRLTGGIQINSSDFEVFDRAYHRADKRHIFGVRPKAVLSGRTELTARDIRFSGVKAKFGTSKLSTNVRIGFDGTMDIDVPDARLELSEMSPLVRIPWSGTANLSAKLSGRVKNTPLVGKLALDNFSFGGFPIGDVSDAAYVFRPLNVVLKGGVVHKHETKYRVPRLKIAFDENATVKVSGHAASGNARVQDLLHTLNFDQISPWSKMLGRLQANADFSYTLGGSYDTCRSGRLVVNGRAQGKDLRLFGEQYDTGATKFSFDWSDMEARHHGMNINLPDIKLTKRDGSLLGSLRISPGAKLQGSMAASAIPFSEVQLLGQTGRVASGRMSGIARIGGTVDEMEATMHVNVSPVILGRSQLPGSSLNVELKPTKSGLRFAKEQSGCRRKIPLPQAAEIATNVDRNLGYFHVRGSLFGNAVELERLRLSWQKNAVLRDAAIVLKRFPLGPFIELNPGIALKKRRPTATMSGRLDIERLPLSAPWRSAGALTVSQLDGVWNGLRLRTEKQGSLDLRDGNLKTKDITLSVSTARGHRATFVAGGDVTRKTNGDLSSNIELRLQPVQLSNWIGLLPQVDSLGGTLGGRVRLIGEVDDLVPQGEFTLAGGTLGVRGQPLAFTNMEGKLELRGRSLHIVDAMASVGGGTVSVKGSAPVNGFRVGRLLTTVGIRGVSVPTKGVAARVSGNLNGTWNAAAAEGDQRPLPKLSGDLRLESFEYSRPVKMSADIAQLTRRGKATEFKSYDPSRDFVNLDLRIAAEQPLRINNNLVDASLVVQDRGLRLTGTNQRFGLRGDVRVTPGGRIQLQRKEFEVSSGVVRFDDPNEINPRVDVTAVTEYRRFTTASTTAGTSSDLGSSTDGARGTGDQWRISMHAYGNANDLKLDLSSEPQLSQDDIFLLLTIGLTRTELDQAQTAALGSGVALEALGSLTGASRAVTEAVTVIDEFRLGSTYSPTTGRTEPTVTIGKRLTERLRAFVTSGISEAREVRSNVEWRLNENISVEGSYDNINTTSSSAIGNLGADVRWRLEFE